MRKLITVAAALLLLPVVSQAKGLEDLLVEKGVITKSEARASVHEGGSKVYWKKGTRLEFPDTGFTAKIKTEVQTRYEFVDTDTDDSNVSNFDIDRARITLAGSALHEEFDYKLAVDFSNGTASVRDAYLQWNACDWGNIRMGQHKPVFSRQTLGSTTKIQFADRSVVSEFFGVDRGRGLSFATGLGDDWEAAAQVFNGLSTGEGRSEDGNDTNHLAVLGVRGDLMGEMDATEEGDLNHTEGTAVNVGAAVIFAENELDFVADTVDEFGVSADVNLKSEGFSFHGEYYYLEHDADSLSEAIESTGFYAQAGYFFVPKEWEVAARYGFIDCDDGRAIGNDREGGIGDGANVCNGNDDVNEVSASLNYHWWKQHLKAQLGYSLLSPNAVNDSDLDADEARWVLKVSSTF